MVLPNFCFLFYFMCILWDASGLLLKKIATNLTIRKKIYLFEGGHDHLTSIQSSSSIIPIYYLFVQIPIEWKIRLKNYVKFLSRGIGDCNRVIWLFVSLL